MVEFSVDLTQKKNAALAPCWPLPLCFDDLTPGALLVCFRLPSATRRSPAACTSATVWLLATSSCCPATRSQWSSTLWCRQRTPYTRTSRRCRCLWPMHPSRASVTFWAPSLSTPMIQRWSRAAPALSHCFYSMLCGLWKYQPLPHWIPWLEVSHAGCHPAQQWFLGVVCPLQVPAVWQEHCAQGQLPIGCDPRSLWEVGRFYGRQTASHPGKPLPQGSEVWICCWSYTKIWTWTFYFSWYRKSDDGSYKTKAKGRVTAVFNLIIHIFEE